MTKLLDITGKALSGEWGIDDDNGNGYQYYFHITYDVHLIIQQVHHM